MRTFTPDELQTILDKHLRWLRDQDGGEKADLSSADLSSANLRFANLRFANLSFANLRSANLRSADLRFANLSSANLRFANLRFANLRSANLSSANLRSAVMGQQQSFADAGIPVIDNIDSKILAAVENGNGKLEMSNWHICETTHCRAGWAIHLAGASGKLLETLIGPSAAGALIYAASRPDKPVPHFTASNEKAMEDLRKCAAEEQAVSAN